jgi:2-phospho-L-lactate guanylyltransferase
MWAVVPLKSPEHAKTRLAGCLSPAQRRQLLFDLAARTIDALQATPAIDAVAVVTASAEIAAFAQARGARPLLQLTETGTAAAFAAAIAQLRPLNLDRLLMIAGDLPLISAAALQTLCAPCAGIDVTIVPDRHRAGTNALLCVPPDVLAPCFGERSFQRHLAAARAANLRARILEIDALALDLDEPADLEELRRRGGSADVAGIGDGVPGIATAG